MPALDITAQVRLRVSDRWRYAEEVRDGNGTAVAFKLAQGAPFASVQSASAYVSVAAGWSATGATFDTGLGLVTFTNVISAQSAWRASYVWALFSDDEITNFITNNPWGGVAGAALEACRALMFDSLRRAKWAAPGGTQYDDTQAMVQLKALYDQLEAEAQASVNTNGIESWSENQPNWSTPYAG